MRYLDANTDPASIDIEKAKLEPVPTIPTAEAQPSPDPAPLQAIDRGLAARLTDNDTNLFEGMLLLFLQMAPERLEKIQTAVARQDRSSLEREVRKIRSAAERIAAVSVAESAMRLMDAVESKQQEDIQHSLVALESQILRLSRHSADSLRADSLKAS
jgi:HPt (histidine-containing phosphotransfer) domain-containing protein